MADEIPIKILAILALLFGGEGNEPESYVGRTWLLYAIINQWGPSMNPRPDFRSKGAGPSSWSSKTPYYEMPWLGCWESSNIGDTYRLNLRLGRVWKLFLHIRNRVRVDSIDLFEIKMFQLNSFTNIQLDVFDSI